MEIEVKNWEKYNPRTDRATSSWFRLQNNIISEPKFFGLTVSQKFITVCLLAEASKNGGARCKIHVLWMADMLKVSPDEIYKTIQHLEMAGMILVTGGNALVSPGISTNERTDVTNGRNELKTKRTLTRRAVGPPEKANEVIAFYCNQWKARTGSSKSPDIRGKEAGQLARFVKDVGVNRAREVIASYFSMPDQLFVRRSWDVSTMLLSLNAISQFEATGKIVTSKVIEHMETKIDKEQGTDKKPRRSLDEMLEMEKETNKNLLGAKK